MANSITIQDTKARNIFDRVEENLSPMSQALWMTGTISPYLRRRAISRFKNSGDDVVKWEALKRVTVMKRISQGFTPGTRKGEINVRTGLLQDYFKTPGPVVFHDPVSTAMAWPGTSRSDLTHRLNQAAGKYRGPARPVVAYGLEDVAYVLASLQVWTMRMRRR